MTDGWPLYESRLKGKLHVISKRYTQRIERHNLNLRQHLARLGRKLPDATLAASYQAYLNRWLIFQTLHTRYQTLPYSSGSTSAAPFACSSR